MRISLYPFVTGCAGRVERGGEGLGAHGGVLLPAGRERAQALQEAALPRAPQGRPHRRGGRQPRVQGQ